MDLARKIDGPVLSEKDALELPGFGLSFELLAVWQDMRACGRVSRADLDPLMLGPRILPHLVIINVLQSGQDYQWRLFGGAHVEEYGVDVTGVCLNQLMTTKNQIDEVKLIFDKCFKEQGPVFYRIQYQNDRKNLRIASGFILPLFDNTEDRPTHLVSCTEWLTGH